MPRSIALATFALLALLIGPLAADDKAKQKFCPVMTTDEIDPNEPRAYVTRA